MKMVILPTDKYIKTHLTKQVKNVQMINGSGVVDDGLLSGDIFGKTPEEKRVLTGYAQWNKYYISPIVYSAYFRRRFRDIDNIISGKKSYSILESGDLVDSELAGIDKTTGTGLSWFYNNYDNIKLKGSDERDDDSMITMGIKRSMRRLAKKEVFTNKLVIIPLIYRDINRMGEGVVKIDELNNLYQKAMSINQLITDSQDNPLVDLGLLDMRMQSTLIEIYDYFVDKLFGKDGIQRRSVMGRKVDYAARAIISAPEFKGSFGSSILGLNRAGYPLSIMSDCGSLEMMYEIDKLLRRYVEMGYFEGVTLSDYEAYMDNDTIKKMIDLYSNSWGERLKKVHIEKSDGTIVNLKIPIKLEGSDEYINREISICEFLYIIAYPIFELKDRIMLISRYPIMDDKNLATTLIHVLSTTHTMKVTIDGLEYPYYPNFKDIDDIEDVEDVYLYEEKIGFLFHETVKMSNTFLKGFDADYDGDKMALRLVMSDDATEECVRKLQDPINLFSLNGDLIKFVGDEAVQTLYSLTINPKNDARYVKQEYINKLLNAKMEDIDPKFIFKELGMAKLKSGQINRHYDLVKLDKNEYKNGNNACTTTLGRLLVNKIIFEISGISYIDVPFTKKVVNDTFATIRDMYLHKKISLETLSTIICLYEDFGFRMSSFITPSVDVNMFVQSENFKNKRQELFEQYADRLKANDIEAAKEIEDKLIEIAKVENEGNEMLEWYESGASGKMSYSNDFKVANIMAGTIPRTIGGGYYVSTSNYIDGIKKDEMHMFASQLVLAAYMRAKNTAVGGYLAKQAIQIFETLKGDKYGSNCGTDDGIYATITEKNKNDYLGRFIAKTNLKIDEKNLNSFIGSTVKIRSPLTCVSENICYHCLGELVYELLGEYEGQINIGLFVNKLYTELTQKSLQKTHVTGAKLSMIKDLNEYITEYE